MQTKERIVVTEIRLVLSAMIDVGEITLLFLELLMMQLILNNNNMDNYHVCLMIFVIYIQWMWQEMCQIHQ